jgi:hypothetical protein
MTAHLQIRARADWHARECRKRDLQAKTRLNQIHFTNIKF